MSVCEDCGKEIEETTPVNFMTECCFCEKSICDSCMEWPEEGQVCKECYKKLQEGEISWDDLD